MTTSKRAVPYSRTVSTVPRLIREPKQERSRQSFDRAVEAAVELLKERRSDAFTLIEVAKKAGVSTGSIYGRVDSKDDLIRAAQVREMDRILREQAIAFEQPVPEGESFADAVARTIHTLGSVLQRNAPVLAPFMLLGNSNSEIALAGKVGFEQSVELFCASLLARKDDMQHPNPQRAVEWSFTVVYSVLARWLGLGSEPEAAGEGEWEQILVDLSAMVTAFLVRPS